MGAEPLCTSPSRVAVTLKADSLALFGGSVAAVDDGSTFHPLQNLKFTPNGTLIYALILVIIGRHYW